MPRKVIDIRDEIITRRLKKHAENLDVPQEVSDRVYQRLLERAPELENLKMDIPEGPQERPGLVKRFLAWVWSYFPS